MRRKALDISMEAIELAQLSTVLTPANQYISMLKAGFGYAPDPSDESSSSESDSSSDDEDAQTLTPQHADKPSSNEGSSSSGSSSDSDEEDGNSPTPGSLPGPTKFPVITSSVFPKTRISITPPSGSPSKSVHGKSLRVSAPVASKKKAKPSGLSARKAAKKKVKTPVSKSRRAANATPAREKTPSKAKATPATRSTKKREAPVKSGSATKTPVTKKRRLSKLLSALSPDSRPGYSATEAKHPLNSPLQKEFFPVGPKEDTLHWGVPGDMLIHHKGQASEDGFYSCGYAAKSSKYGLAPEKEKCGYMADNKAVVSTHLRRCHLSHVLRCPLCSYRAWGGRAWEEHMKKQHRQERNQWYVTRQVHQPLFT